LTLIHHASRLGQRKLNAVGSAQFDDRPAHKELIGTSDANDMAYPNADRRLTPAFARIRRA
jgi:hypothetical protein